MLHQNIEARIADILDRFDSCPEPSFERRWRDPGQTESADALRHRKPLLLDLFCCAGGAGVGYRRAGFRPLCKECRKAKSDTNSRSFKQEHEDCQEPRKRRQPDCRCFGRPSATSSAKRLTAS